MPPRMEERNWTFFLLTAGGCSTGGGKAAAALFAIAVPGGTRPTLGDLRQRNKHVATLSPTLDYLGIVRPDSTTTTTTTTTTMYWPRIGRTAARRASRRIAYRQVRGRSFPESSRLPREATAHLGSGTPDQARLQEQEEKKKEKKKVHLPQHSVTAVEMRVCFAKPATNQMMNE